MIKQRIKNHLTYYGFLSFAMIVGLTLVSYFQGNPSMQLLSVTFLTFIYISLGLTHHFLQHDITLKIVIEYILIGSLAISVIFFLI